MKKLVMWHYYYSTGKCYCGGYATASAT